MMKMNKENKKNVGKMSIKMNVLCAALWGFAAAMNAMAGQWGLGILNVALMGYYLCRIEEQKNGEKKQVESLA